MKINEYQSGDKVYYTGDMANQPGEGIIVGRREANKYCPLMARKP